MNQSDPLEIFWRPIVNQYLSGATALPPFLGLEEADYFSLLDLLSICDLAEQHQLTGRQLRKELLSMRRDEYVQLHELLTQYVISDDNITAPFNSTRAVCDLIAAGCLSSAHLWHDLGLPERPRLSALFAHYFPELKKMNNKNMRWKRFLYKQLCENGGDYVCRSPSCETCTSYTECFLSPVEE